mgnify:FL=1
MSSSSSSSASVETKNKTAGWKVKEPQTEAAAESIIKKIADEIYKGIKSLITAQNDQNAGKKGKENAYTNFNVRKIFKHLPYYQPFINNAREKGLLGQELMFTHHRYRSLLVTNSFKIHKLGGYSIERIGQLITDTTPYQVIVILHKVFTFLRNNVAPHYDTDSQYIDAVLNRITPQRLQEAERQYDAMNILLIANRQRRQIQHPDIDGLAGVLAANTIGPRQAQGGNKKLPPLSIDGISGILGAKTMRPIKLEGGKKNKGKTNKKGGGKRERENIFMKFRVWPAENIVGDGNIVDAVFETNQSNDMILVIIKRGHNSPDQRLAQYKFNGINDNITEEVWRTQIIQDLNEIGYEVLSILN